MPDFRGISVALRSQYDCCRIPEYPPPRTPVSPSPKKLKDSQAIFNSYNSSISPYPPEPDAADVLVPIYPGSQFWIEHTLLDSTPMSLETKYVYFKLFIDRKCALSWGVGQEDGWSAKVMFAICSGGTYFESRKVLEKKAFVFSKIEDGKALKGGFEIKVYRSNARKREEVSHEQLQEVHSNDQCVSFVPAGRLHKSDPKKSYTYALLDSLQQPYAVFRYHFRTRTLDSMDLDGPIDDDYDDDIRFDKLAPITDVPSKTDFLAPRSTSEPDFSTPERGFDSTDVTRCLSVPSPSGLALRKARESHSPTKRQSASDRACLTADLGKLDLNRERIECKDFISKKPPRIVEDSEVRRRNGLERAATPPASLRRAGSRGLLNKVVSSALKRRGNGKSGCRNGGAGGGVGTR